MLHRPGRRHFDNASASAYVLLASTGVQFWSASYRSDSTCIRAPVMSEGATPGFRRGIFLIEAGERKQSHDCTLG